jgi:hypothetical protein
VHRDQAVRRTNDGYNRGLGAAAVAVDYELNLVNLVGSEIAETAGGILFASQIVHSRDIRTREQHMLQFHRSEENNFGGSAAGSRGGHGAGDRGVVHGTIEQGWRSEAYAHLDHLYIKAAPGKKSLLYRGVNRQVAQRWRSGGDPELASTLRLHGRKRWDADPSQQKQ